MSKIQKYTFSKPGYGSLELELAAASRQIYQSSLPASIPFKTEGLEPDPGQEIDSIYFYEWQNIQYVYINDEQSLFRPPFKLKINERIHKTSSLRGHTHLLSGYFSFRNEVGESSIEIRDADNKLIFRLNAEVFPQKMDYKSDYKAMMEDISSIIQSLAFDALKDTFRKTRAKITGHTTQHEWWSILDVLFDNLIIHLSVIRSQPRHEIRSHENVLQVEKVRQASKRTVDWMRKNTLYSNKAGKGLKIGNDNYFTHSLSGKKHITYDTYENRFVVWAVKSIIDQLGKYYQYIHKNADTEAYADLLHKIKKYQGRLQSVLHQHPFNEAGAFEKRAHFSASLTRGAGYRDFMYVYLMLTRGLEIVNNDIFKIEQKDISTLYEYWCFLMLVKLLKEQNGSAISFQDLIQVSAGRFKVTLKKDEESKVQFTKSDTNEVTTIYFNKEYKSDGRRIFTYNQRPDYSIEFGKKGFEKPFWYLFDAKYRFEENTESEKNDFNVPQDAIGQLHRYRDAILHSEPVSATYRSAMKNLGGIILYPYPLPEETFKSNAYYKSISNVNIGAMPFLPSKTSLVNNFLNTLINKSAEEHFEQFIEMDRTEYEDQRSLWKEWVTISVVPKEHQQERLQFIEEKNLFHIPFVANANSRLYMTKKILVCKAGTTTAWLYDVTGWEIMNEQELRNAGTGWQHKKEKYIVFHLANRQELKTPHKMARAGLRYATLEGLNRYISDPAKGKNNFYLSNPDAARLSEELTRLNIAFEINWAQDENDPSLIQFKIGDKQFFSSDKFSSLTYTTADGKRFHLSEIINEIVKSKE